LAYKLEKDKYFIIKGGRYISPHHVNADCHKGNNHLTVTIKILFLIS